MIRSTAPFFSAWSASGTLWAGSVLCPARSRVSWRISPIAGSSSRQRIVAIDDWIRRAKAMLLEALLGKDAWLTQRQLLPGARIAQASTLAKCVDVACDRRAFETQ